MELNTKQKKVYSKIQKFCNLSYNRNKLLILGPSGSGKTTVITQALFDLPSIDIERICFTAFTNKATNVLYNIISKNNSKILRENKIKLKCTTIHNLLKLEPNTIFLPKNKNKKYLQKIKDNWINSLYVPYIVQPYDYTSNKKLLCFIFQKSGFIVILKFDNFLFHKSDQWFFSPEI